MSEPLPKIEVDAWCGIVGVHRDRRVLTINMVGEKEARWLMALLAVNAERAEREREEARVVS